MLPPPRPFAARPLLRRRGPRLERVRAAGAAGLRAAAVDAGLSRAVAPDHGAHPPGVVRLCHQGLRAPGQTEGRVQEAGVIGL